MIFREFSSKTLRVLLHFLSRGSASCQSLCSGTGRITLSLLILCSFFSIAVRLRSASYGGHSIFGFVHRPVGLDLARIQLWVGTEVAKRVWL